MDEEQEKPWERVGLTRREWMEIKQEIWEQMVERCATNLLDDIETGTIDGDRIAPTDWHKSPRD